MTNPQIKIKRKDCSILLTGCNSKIKVFDFNQGMTKESQILSQFQSNIFTLDSWINQISLYLGVMMVLLLYGNTIQIINGFANKYQMDMVVLSIVQYQIIMKIQLYQGVEMPFWMKNNEWMRQQTITDHHKEIDDRIFSCGSDNFFQYWKNKDKINNGFVIQKITVEQFGHWVCFFDNNMFTFSQFEKESLSIFEINSINQQFTKTSDINVNCGSDNFFYFLNNLSIHNISEKVQLIRKQLNGQFVTEQSIHNDEYQIYVRMSDDGGYLITWDYK
ncbi:unnamed protein product [Paramecium octaurelia]|uniref:Uncharacterized protein n=1 Tax=Paramecium octaurelia TaxID=43137 RepID=A0A8S1YRP6_PAROT|nr:unnamed protein product [Paramecium octaurelia]